MAVHSGTYFYHFDLPAVSWLERVSKPARVLRLVLVALSIVVVFGYTGSRGVAVGVGTLVRPARDYSTRSGLPTVTGLLSVAVGPLSICAGGDRVR